MPGLFLDDAPLRYLEPNADQQEPALNRRATTQRYGCMDSHNLSTIEHTLQEGRGSHHITDENNQRIAEMTFVKAGTSRIIIDHTFVDESLRGQGIGRQLLEATAEYARKANMKILATCPYAKAELEKHREQFRDVMA